MRKAPSTRHGFKVIRFLTVNRLFATILFALVTLSPMTGPAGADTLQLNNGRTLDGRVVVRDNGDVELHSSMGMIVIPAARVAKLSKSQPIEDRVLDELVERPNVTADDLFELGDEARREGASTLAKKLFSEAIRMDPDHGASRRALGYYRTDEGWRNGPRPVKSADRVNIEQAERVALLRALRAQANAARVAEQQRQAFLATQTALANAAAARSVAMSDGRFLGGNFGGNYVQRGITVIPVISHGFGPVPPRTHGWARSSAKGSSTRTAVAPQKPRRRPRTNTIVRIPPP